MFDLIESTKATQSVLGIEEGLDLPQATAEKIVKRALEPLNQIENKVQSPLEFDEDHFPTNLVENDVTIEVSLGVVRDLIRDVGLLGMALAYRYRKDEEYFTTVKTLARENLKLDNTIETLLERLSEKSDTIEK